MDKKHLYSIITLTFFFLLNTGLTQGQSNNQQTPTLEVGVAGGAPFVADTTRETGIALEIWGDVANKERLSYNLNFFESVPKALNALDGGDLDVLVGPISITPERAKKVKFTQPYYQSSLGIMSRTISPSFWQRIKQLLSIQMLYAVFVFLFILAVVGSLLWAAEHKVNPEEFSSDPLPGIGDGMWCAIVTMTTTGYGDLSPRTLGGRIIAGSWMVICIVFATTMVAGIASTLTVAASDTEAIEKANQLSKHKVGVVENSPAEEFIDRFGAESVYVENLEEGYKKLKGGAVDAIVFDRPQMLYFLKQHHDEEVNMATQQYMRQGYGFAVPLDSEKLFDLDITILKLQQSGKIDRTITNWLGENE